MLRRSQDDGIEKQNGGVQHELDRKDLSDVEAGAGRRRPRRMRWSRLLGIFLPWFCMLCMAAAQLQHFRLDRLTALAHLSSEHPSSGLTIVSGFFFVRDGKKHTQHGKRATAFLRIESVCSLCSWQLSQLTKSNALVCRLLGMDRELPKQRATAGVLLHIAGSR